MSQIRTPQLCRQAAPSPRHWPRRWPSASAPPIAERGAAAIAVSGGTTPARFFQALGKTKDIDWAKVIVTLVDERWVDETSDRSNAMLVNERMLQGPAAVARFFPLYSGGDEPDHEAVAKTNALLARPAAPVRRRRARHGQ